MSAVASPSISKSMRLKMAQDCAISKGGLCLSTQYETARLPLLWECKEGHRWEASSDNVVRGGRWCPKCGHAVTAKKKEKFSLDVCKELALRYGAKCISKEKPQVLKKYEWTCSKGHSFFGTPLSHLKNKFTCPKCKAVKTKKLKTSGKLPDYIDRLCQLQEIAASKNGQCLSTSYKGSNHKLLWRCVDGHDWESTAGSIKGGTWCPVCSGHQRLSIEDARKAAERKGGKCLSTEYKNARTKLLWECAEGHQWSAKYDSVNRSTWCPTCSLKLLGEKTRKYTPQDLETIAQQRGGHFLSETYEGALRNHKWQCARGHTWMASPSSVINAGSWCSSCSRYLSERICNIAFEKITGRAFIKGRPNWLRSPNDTQMEFDGYCEELSIAWEHHGLQHFQDITAFKSKMPLNQRMVYDEAKRALARNHGITLIEIPQLTRLLSIEQLSGFIVNLLRRSGRGDCVVYEGVIDYASAYIIDDRINDLFELAKSRGGKCLTNAYLGARYKYIWECGKGHQWSQSSDAIKRGIWCPHCSGRHNINIDTAREYARKFEGELISQEYKNSHTHLLWRCKRGHEFTMNMAAARGSGRFCSICNKQEKKG
jgi:REP element-mobilizing transposase RayT